MFRVTKTPWDFSKRRHRRPLVPLVETETEVNVKESSKVALTRSLVARIVPVQIHLVNHSASSKWYLGVGDWRDRNQ